MKKSKLTKILAVVLVLAMSFAFTAAAKPVSADPGDSTVYVMTDAAGKAEKLIVTDAVASALEKRQGKGLIITNSDGTELDLGNHDDIMPINVSISYTLNGKKISPKKLAGKSGHVTIRYDYENLCKTKAMIGGKEEEIFVPFAVATGLVVDNENFKNIEVSSGKVISDGSRSIIGGVALPGLQSNLNIGKDIIELPEYVEISADVTDFKLDMSLSLVTNDIFDGQDLSLDTAELETMVNQLRNAMNMLIDGAAQLYDGIDLLSKKSGELVDGVSQLHSGMQELDSHSAELVGGVDAGFDSILNMGTNVIIKLGLSSTALTRDNYRQVLQDLINSLDANVLIDTALDKIIETLDLNEIRKTAELIVMHEIEQNARQAEYDRITAEVEQAKAPELREQTAKAVRGAVVLEVTDDLTSEVRNNILAEKNLTMDDYYNLSVIERGIIEKKVALAMAAPGTVQRISEETDARMASEEIQNRIDGKIHDAVKVAAGLEIANQHEAIEHKVREVIDAQMATPEMQARVEEVYKNMVREAALALLTDDIKAQIQNMADEGARALGELLAGLTSYEQLVCGIKAYTAGVSSAAAGVSTLYSNMPALVSGINQLKDGSQLLYDGVLRFDREGISRITGALDGEVGELRDRIKASAEAAENYAPIEGLKNAKLSFVYRSGSIA